MHKYDFKPYNAQYPELFAEEKKRLALFLSQDVIIEHVGSTAVDGLGGEGVIDIAICSVRFETLKNKIIDSGYREGLGFSSKDRYFFKRYDDDLKVTFHLQVVNCGDPIWAQLVGFRDFLRKNHKAKVMYESVKKEASLKAADS